MLIIVLLVSCSKSNSKNDTADKEIITINNIGYIHNYLLSQYDTKILKSNKEKTFEEVYRGMEKELIESDVYSELSNIKQTLNEDETKDFFESFAKLKMEKEFFDNLKCLLIKHIQNLNNVDNEIKIALLK